MDIGNRRQLKYMANEALNAASYNPKKLMLIHGAVTVGVSLVLSLLSLFLSYQIEGTGGLGGLGARNILETLQTLLSYAYTLLLPFWEISILYSAMCIGRRKKADPQTLKRGFFRFGPVLRLKLLEVVLYFLIAMACAYVSSFLLMAFSSRFEELLEPVMQAITEDPYVDIGALIAQIPVNDLLRAMLPVLLVFIGLYLVIVVLLSYRLRLAEYIILDDPKTGAFAAIGLSLRLTKRNCVNLFRLDLSFWWYYALQALALLISYCDVILSAIGIPLPMSTDLAAIVFYCVYAILILYMNYQFRPQIETTYALAYDALRNPLPVVNSNGILPE